MQYYGERAIPAFRTAIELRPRLTEAYAQLIFMLNGLASGEEAMEWLRQGLSAVPDSVRLHSAHLWMLQPQWGGDLTQMAGAIDQISRDFPSNKALQALRGKVNVTIAGAMSRSGDAAGALRYLEAARQLGLHADVFEARLLVALGRPAEALLAYGRALERWPQDVEANQGIANLLAVTPAAVGFQRHLDLLLALDRLNPLFLALRAGHLARAGEREEAALAYEDALIYGAYDPDVLTAAGEFLIDVPAKRTSAIMALDRALDMSPEDASLRQRVSAALRRLDDCSLVPRLDELLDEYVRLCTRARCPLLEFNRTGWALANNLFRDQCGSRSTTSSE
jgi:tetratricopeptide (TPR) repeat protein